MRKRKRALTSTPSDLLLLLVHVRDVLGREAVPALQPAQV